ncbi:Gfo/Idh/MocA family protein [Streptomyces sp. NPDC056653]|uniref:Gfo/Idh/MocA family protein n=1 Tax=Streptomyces sp. NPDC056653 TaxID=3345894 RepID=UPI0036B6FB49
MTPVRPAGIPPRRISCGARSTAGPPAGAVAQLHTVSGPVTAAPMVWAAAVDISGPAASVSAATALPAMRPRLGTVCERSYGPTRLCLKMLIEGTVESCDNVLRAAYETGTRLYVGHNMRHMGVVRLMRDIIARGDIGEPKAVWVRHFVGYGGDYYFKDWHADRTRTTGLLLQKAAHDIDVLHWLAGGYTRRVNALGDLLVYGGLPRREADTPRPDNWLREFDWPPTARKDLHHIVDVEDVSVMNMQLDNGVVAAYQQCHFTPDYWRNCTVIGTEGRLENFGDSPGDEVKVWNTGPSGYRAGADITYRVPEANGSHGGGDSRIMEEFCRFVRAGGVTDTSPVAARMSVAAGVLATRSLREGGAPYDVPALDLELIAYFERGQVR